jgi:hypothetical protein
MIPQGVTPEQFGQMVCQAVLAVEALVYVELNN